MLHSRRVRRYQEFLKTLRPRSEPRVCLCALHLHPRPWVHAPCRTSRPHGEPSLVQSRRFHSNPDLLEHSPHPTVMERRSLTHKDRDEHSQYMERLHRGEDLIKEAQRRVNNGETLPKDVYNTVMKWSKMTPKAEEAARDGEQRRERRQQHESSHSRRRKENSERDFEREEERLRRELRNVREVTQNNIQLLEENKRLMKKIQKLRQRVKRQSEAAKGSRDSVEVPGNNKVLQALKKKYEDLLQYVLRVEAENQKLNSLIGASGEGCQHMNDTDFENTTRRTLTDLQRELQTLRKKVKEKDENLTKYEEELKDLKDRNVRLQDTIRRQGERDTKRPEGTLLEEEWIRRFNETRKMYEEAIQGYKDELERTQRRQVEEEQNHARQTEELAEKLEETRRKLKSKETELMERKDKDISGSPEDLGGKLLGGSAVEGNEGNEVVIDAGMGNNTQQDPLQNPDGRDTGREGLKGGAMLSESELDNDGTDARKGGSKGNTTQEINKINTLNDGTRCDEEGGKSDTKQTDKLYNDALELIVRRLETLQLGREDAEGVIGVIKDTINTCLQEWRDREHQDEDKRNLQLENEELQRKLKGRNKKIESLQKQIQDQDRQNERLLHQCSVLEARAASSQTTEQLGILAELPQKFQETEQHLADTRDLVHRAQVENQSLQTQVKHLEEKLSKKDTKLRAEREQSSIREKEVAEAKESASFLQHQLEDASREVNQLRELVTTKDVILEHMSAQLEEKIRECASLSALVNRYKVQHSQDSDNMQTRISEREAETQKQMMELQAQVSRYHAQLSALRAEKEHAERTLRTDVRKLEEQVDQLNLRNSTLQRQLTTFTSTYHTMFSGVELNPVTSPPGDTSALKGV